MTGPDMAGRRAKRVVMVRHGNTFEPGEPVRRIGARTDPPLTEEGRRQARAVAAWLNREGIARERILSGPLRRARETAAIIAGVPGPPNAVEEAAWLDEVDYGPDEGRPESSVIARVGAAALAAWDRHGQPAPGWPVDPVAMRQRISVALGALPPQDTVLVTSNGTARFIPLSLGLGDDLPSLKLRTGAFGMIVIDGSHAAIEQWDVRPD